MLLVVLLVTKLLLLILAFLFGISRRPWWMIGLLALVICAPLQVAEFWTSYWRYQVGLPYQDQPLNWGAIAWIVGPLLLCAYVGYALGLLYSYRRRLAAVSREVAVRPISAHQWFVFRRG